MANDSEHTYQMLREKAGQFAQAEAERVYLSEFRKSKKSILMKKAEEANPGMSAAAQEREAYADKEYCELLEGLRYATEIALKIKFEMKVIEMQFESWRTKQANKRAEANLR